MIHQPLQPNFLNAKQTRPILSRPLKSSGVPFSDVSFSGKTPPPQKETFQSTCSRRFFLKQTGLTLALASLLPKSLINTVIAQEASPALASPALLPYDEASASQVQNYLIETLRLAQSDTPARQAVHWDRIRPNLFVMAKFNHPGLVELAHRILSQNKDSVLLDTGIPENVSHAEALQDLCAALGLYDSALFQQQPQAMQDVILKALLDLSRPVSFNKASNGNTSELNSQTYPIIQGSLTPLQQAACYAWTQLAPEPLRHEYLQTYTITLPAETRLNRLKQLRHFINLNRLPEFFIDILSKQVQTYLEKPPTQPEERAVWGETLNVLSLWASQQNQTNSKMDTNKASGAVNDILQKGIKGFFQLKDPITKVTYPNPGDYSALEALARLSVSQPELIQQLTQLWLTHPEVMLNACQANIKGEFTPAYMAGEQLRQVYRTHGVERLRETFVSWLKNPEKLKTPESLSKLLQAPLNPSQLNRVQSAALAMLASRPDESLRPLFLDCLEKGDEWMSQVSILALEAIHHLDDLPALVSVAHNTHYPEKTRVLAGQVALKFIYPKELPADLRQKIEADFPLNGLMDRFFEFGPEGTVTRLVDTASSSDWMEMLTKSCHADPPVLIQKTVLQPTLEQIQNTPQSPARLVANIQLLRLAGYEAAYPALVQVLNQPAKSVSSQSLPSEYEARAEALHQIKRTALQSLGRVIPLSNLQDIRQLGSYLNPQVIGIRSEGKPQTSESKSALPSSLPIVGKFVGYQHSLLTTLNDIGKRFQAKKQASGLNQVSGLNTEEEVLLGFLQKQVLQQFWQASRPLASEAQAKHSQNQLRVALATTLIHLGGEDVVLQIVRGMQRTVADLRSSMKTAPNRSETGEIENTPNILWHQDTIATLNDASRDALHSLIAEGKHLNSPEVVDLLNIPSWDLKKLHEQSTGKGESVVLIDGNVGYALAVPAHLKKLMPDLKDKITYPKAMLMRPQYFEQGYHWLRVLSILLNVAPDLNHINSRTWDGLLKAPPPFSTQAMTYPPVMAMMDLMESKLLPPNHPDYEPARLVSNSWGNSSNRIYDDALRMQYNVLSGLYESFERLGGLTVYSGGNGGYDRPLSEFSAERGNSPIGDGFTSEGECLPTQGVFYALPDDPLNESLTTRASAPVTADDSASRSFFKIPGVHPVLSYDEVTHQPFGHWGMASSYAAPALSGLMALLNEQAKRQQLGAEADKSLTQRHPPRPLGKDREQKLLSVSKDGEFQTWTPDPKRLFGLSNPTKTQTP
jgi:hypothetical protein